MQARLCPHYKTCKLALKDIARKIFKKPYILAYPIATETVT